MYWLVNCASVAFATLLVLEGLSFCGAARPLHIRWFGRLTLCLAAPAFVLYSLLLEDALVLSPEFGVILVEGSRARLGLAFVLVSAALVSALLWHGARVKRDPASRLWPLFIVAALVGLVTAQRLQALTPEDAPGRPAYAYDVWWPLLLTWIAICLIQGVSTVLQIKSRAVRAVLTVVAITAMSVRALLRPEFADPSSETFWTLVLGASVLAIPGLVVWGLVNRFRAPVDSDRPTWRALLTWWNIARSTRPRVLLVCAGLIVLLMALSSLLRWQLIGPLLALSAFVLVWILLAEALGGEPFVGASHWTVVREIRIAGSPVRAASRFVWARLTAVGSYAGRWVRGTTTVNSVASALIKTLIGLAILIALSDVPNAGRTIIYPFDSTAIETPKRLGQSFSDRLLSELGVLEEELKPVMIAVSANSTFTVVTATTGTNSVDAALAKSNDFEYGSLKIPLNLFVAPIQIPMRNVLGARVITGALYLDRQDYSVLAISSSGEAWKAQVPPKEGSVDVQPGDAIRDLARQLAFKITTSTAPANAGLTHSWQAYQPFSRGLTAWRQYKSGNWDELTNAIAEFRRAVQEDATFSVARYRLGIALQEDGQPAAAAEAFRESMRANPQFAAAYVALAYTLYDFNSYSSQYVSAAAAVQPESRPGETKARHMEARRLWQQVLAFDNTKVLVSDRASSYLGLCRATDDSATAYLYCKRAEALYASLENDLQIDESYAVTLNQLGALLSRKGRKATTSQTLWHCLADSVDVKDIKRESRITKRAIWSSPYDRDALRYYQRALSLMPTDPVIRCNAASTAYALGDSTRMTELSDTPRDRLNLGEEFMRLATSSKAALYYRLALDEYSAAIAFDPTNIDALNRYAYTFWKWRYDSSNSDIEPPPTVVARYAESYARNAVRLSAGSDRVREVQVRSTLGEVLLGQARPHEAIAELERLLARPPQAIAELEQVVAPKHSAFDEIRWDLSQAYLCAVAADNGVPTRREEAQAAWAKASKLMDEIRDHEQGREARQFTPNPRQLDVARSLTACTRPPEPGGGFSTEGRRPRFVLKDGRPKYSSHLPCEWLGVTAQTSGTTSAAPQLRVWGGGVDASISVRGEPGDHIFLTSRPQNTHDYYFAQLEDENQEPASLIYPLETFANDAPDRCMRNMITLVFGPTDPI